MAKVEAPNDLSPEEQKRIVEAMAFLDTADHYALLGVPRAADKKEIKRGYYERAALYHPDRYFRRQPGDYKPMLEAIFARIEAQALEASLHRLVGAEYLTIAKARHAAYGTAIGATAPLSAPPAEPSIAEPLRQVRAGIAAYGRIVAALVEMGEFTEAVATQALAPVDRIRAAQRERREADTAASDEVLSSPLPQI